MVISSCDLLFFAYDPQQVPVERSHDLMSVPARVAELLNFAKLSSGSDQASAFHAAQELLIHQEGGRHLDEFAPLVIEFAVDPSPAIRKATVDFARAATELKPHLAPITFPCLCRLLADSSAAIVKAAITAAQTLVPITLRAVLASPQMPQAQQVVHHVCTLLSSVLALLSAPSFGTVLVVVRFVEAVSTSPVFHIGLVPNDHPILLRQDAEALLVSLIVALANAIRGFVPTASNTTTVSAMINSLAKIIKSSHSICRVVHACIPLCLSAILHFLKQCLSSMDVPDSSKESIRRATRTALLLVVPSIVEGTSTHASETMSVAHDVFFLLDAVREFEQRLAYRSGSADVRLQQGNASAALAQFGAGGMFAGLQSASAQHGGSVSAPAAVPAASGMSRKRPGSPVGQEPLKAPRLAADADDDELMTDRDREREKLDEARLKRDRPDSLVDAPAFAQDLAKARAPLLSFEDMLVGVWDRYRTCERMISRAHKHHSVSSLVFRVIHRQLLLLLQTHLSTSAGFKLQPLNASTPLHMDVSAFRDASTLLNTFISYFANSPDDLHADACLAWSHSLLALPLESATLHSLYDSVFDSLFTLLHAKIEQKDSVSAASLYLLRLASELPRLTSAMMHVVERCAYLPDREEKTISSLAAHVLYRQPVRQHALDMLMRLSVCDLLSKLSQDGGETESPSPVNEVLTQKHAIVALVRLSRDARFASSISSFATESLLSLRQMVGAQTAPNPEDSQAAPVSSSDASNSTSNVDIVDVQVRRKCLLFFALAARQKDMIVMLFAEFPKMPKPAQTALMTHVSDLFRALGPRSATLIEALKQAPSAAGDLVVHCINSIAALPAPDGNTVLFLGPLATVVRDAVASKTFDARALVPLLGHPAIPKTLVLDTLPSLLCLGAAVVTTVIQRLVSSPEAGISPAELLVRGHTASIANVADASIPERVFTVRQIEFINTCLAQRTFFTEMVIATALQQMASFQQIPMLFMRTLMQAVTIYPTMVDTCVNVMSRLVEKQIWTVPQLWQGFLKCVDMCKPKSADVLLRLPAAQFRDALSENPSLKELLRRTVRPNQLGPAQRQALFDEGR